MNQDVSVKRAAGRDINQNQRTYESPDVVLLYKYRRNLQPPEARVRSLLTPQLSQMAMLDIGVGGGRTAGHFLGQVADYVAIDYSPGMVEASRRRFPDWREAFRVGDVRSMNDFSDGRFDFVLYSFNGIDYMGHDDRLRALREIRRVMRPRGVFCFSSHNLRAVPSKLWPPLTLNPIVYLRELIYRARLQLLNRRETLEGLEDRDFQIIRDLPRLLTYYVSPAEQLRQLAEAGFGKARIFGLRDGAELAGAAHAERSDDAWHYYLCEAV